MYKLFLGKNLAKVVISLCLAITLIFGYGANYHFATADAGEKYFTILHTNDEHSALVPSPLVDYHPEKENYSLGGFPRLAQAVFDIRAEKERTKEPVLLISGGDFLGGSPFAWLALQGIAPELSLMLKLGYDVITIGNHEYDYGPDLLADYLKTAGYPAAREQTAIVASNTLAPVGHPLNYLGITKTHIKELENGLTLGFFGLMGKDADQVAPLAEPVEFVDQIAVAKEMVQKLTDEKVDIIIAVTHSGIDEDRELAQEVDGIDIIVGGHSHTALKKPVIENSTIIIQAGELLQHLGILELGYNPSTGTLRIRNTETEKPHLLPLDQNVPSSPWMTELVDAYTDELNSLVSRLTRGRFNNISDTIVYSDFSLPNKPPLKESPFGNFVTDAMRLGAEEALGKKVDFAFQANGVLRGPIVPGAMPHSQGQVSFFDLVDLVGLGSGPDGEPGYPMVSVYFTGEEVRRVLEISHLLSEIMGDTYFLQISGLKTTYDSNRAILMWLPIKNIPIPTSRTVITAEKFVGEGIQEKDENYQTLARGDEELYHIVSDYYIASFLPMVGEMLPSLGLEMKDEEGNPVNIEDRIIYRNGEEYKVWQAVVEHAANQPPGADGNPRILDVYEGSSSRLVEVRTIPLLFWPILGLGVLTALIIYLLRRRKARKLESKGI